MTYQHLKKFLLIALLTGTTRVQANYENVKDFCVGKCYQVYATLVPVHLYDDIQVSFDYHANVILSSFDIFLGAWIAEKCHKTRKTSLISLSN